MSGKFTEESMFLSIRCSSTKSIWYSLKDTYHQANKDKEFQMKQHLHTMIVGSKFDKDISWT